MSNLYWHRGMAQVLGYLAMIAWELRRYDEGKQLIEENLAIQQALGNQMGIGDMFSTLGWIALTQGQLEQAEQLAQKCTTFYGETGDQSHIAKGLRDLAAPKIYLGKFTEADLLLEESVAIFNELGGGGDLEKLNQRLAAQGNGSARCQTCTEACVTPCQAYFLDVPGAAHSRKWSGAWFCISALVFPGLREGMTGTVTDAFDWELEWNAAFEMNVLSNRYGLNHYDLLVGLVPWLIACQKARCSSSCNRV